ncbi:TIGR02270 family protein [Pyxidicoccus sp. 3LG]
MREDLLPRWDIYEEHLDEASFLWMRWERCLLAPHYDLSETAELEERLLAHLAALAEPGGAIAKRLLWPALESDEPSRQCAAAYALLASGGEQALDPLLRLIEADLPGLAAAAQRAMELGPWPGCTERLQVLADHPSPALKALALEALAFHGLTPAGGLATHLEHEDARVRRAGLRCARFLPPESLPTGLLRLALASDDAALRMAAIEVGLQHGWRAAWASCREVAHGPGMRAEAWVLLALGGSDEELRWLVERLGDVKHQAPALWALGFSGSPSAAAACLALLREKPPVPALAAEAFSAITGLPIQGRYSTKPPEESVQEDVLDADLTPKPEDELPLPAPDALMSWWQEAQARFDPAQRYLFGRPLESDVLMDALTRASMRRRPVLALELALRGRGAPFLQTRAFTRRQRSELHRLHSARPALSLLPFARSHTR